MKTIYTFLILILVGCEENVNVIKSIPVDKDYPFYGEHTYSGTYIHEGYKNARAYIPLTPTR